MEIFERALERVRKKFALRVYGYVVMPEHVHLLLSEPQRGTLADALKSLKQGVARRLIGGAEHFWQKRYCDFNMSSLEFSGWAARSGSRCRVNTIQFSLPLFDRLLTG